MVVEALVWVVVEGEGNSYLRPFTFGMPATKSFR